MHKLIEKDKNKYITQIEEITMLKNKEIESLKDSILKQDKEIKYLRKKILIPNTNSNNKGNSNNEFNKIQKEKVGQSSLYESILVHIKTININYLLEIYNLNLQREEEIKKILEDNHKGKHLQEYKKHTLELIKNFDYLQSYCQEEIKLCNERSKMYIPPDVSNTIMILIF